MNTQRSIGFLHPGAMGVSLAASAIASGHESCWVDADRSDATRSRADEHGLRMLDTLGAMCERCEFIVSICPPSAADDVADAVIECGFGGVYIDANAISPMRARSISQRINDHGASYVDGSVIGGPAWTKDATVLYLSGPGAGEAAACFSGGLLATRVIGEAVDRASALKMCYAAYTKGSTAMLCAVVAAASALGVDGELDRQWELDETGARERTHLRVRAVTAKAWRYEGEMCEIAQTMKHAGLPGGFHEAAAEIYARLGGFKGQSSRPELAEVIARMLGA
ncbi:MAG: NAD(P)-dependent oxidoreductase [Phycisphaerales bacterium]|nr:NAD(P)-dependent oxidoreductase [Phycisphaerales bacterium]